MQFTVVAVKKNFAEIDSPPFGADGPQDIRQVFRSES